MPARHPHEPEAELLLCCARTSLDAQSAARMCALLGAGVDWDRVLRLGGSHGLLPLLHWHLKTVGPEVVADEVLTPILEGLQDQSLAIAARNLFLTGELIRLLRLLEAHGISAIPFKGPVLAAAVFGSLTLRRCEDLDVLVHPRDVVRATELILAQGYLPKTPRTAAQEAVHRRSSYCTKFLGAEGRVVLELHWSFRPSDLPLHLDPDSLWERVESIPLVGTTVRSLRPELLLLLLCAHGCGHRWQVLKWLCDINELLRSYPGLDWSWTLDQARRTGSERMLLLGLRLAAELLGAALPREVHLRTHALCSNLAAPVAYVCQTLFQESDALSPGARRMSERAYLFGLRERWWDRAAYCLHLARGALTPGADERALISLPEVFSPVYYILRALRLIGKYSLLLLRRSR